MTSIFYLITGVWRCGQLIFCVVLVREAQLLRLSKFLHGSVKSRQVSLLQTCSRQAGVFLLLSPSLFRAERKRREQSWMIDIDSGETMYERIQNSV